MGAVLDHLAAPEQPLDRGMHAEFRLEVLNLDLLPRQVFRRDDESEGDGRFVRVQESATAEAHRRLPGVHERGAFLLAEAESVLNRFRRKFDRFLDSDGDFSWNQGNGRTRSEEHTSELQSQSNLVCRLLLEKKNNVGYSVVDTL